MVRASIVVLLILGVAAVAVAANPPADFSAKGMMHALAPSEHTPGEDNGIPLEKGLHQAGEDCGLCHTPGGRAGNRVFTLAGTLYEDRFGSRPLVGAEVIAADVEGNIISMTTNSVGNFWTEAAIASNPKATSSGKGGVPEPLFGVDAEGNFLTAAPEDDPRTWQYKIWLKNADQVTSMVTVPPVGGNTTTAQRMSCNMHHSPTGGTGAAWVSRMPAVSAGYPETGLSFRQHIQPILMAKCVPCHTPGVRTTRPITETDLDGSTRLDYSGGHDFTSYDGSTVTVGSGDTAQVIDKNGVIDAVNVGYPELSKILTHPMIQPAGAAPVHTGGGFWLPGDPDYEAIRRWIAEGARPE